MKLTFSGQGQFRHPLLDRVKKLFISRKVYNWNTLFPLALAGSVVAEPAMTGLMILAMATELARKFAKSVVNTFNDD